MKKHQPRQRPNQKTKRRRALVRMIPMPDNAKWHRENERIMTELNQAMGISAEAMALLSGAVSGRRWKGWS